MSKHGRKLYAPYKRPRARRATQVATSDALYQIRYGAFLPDEIIERVLEFLHNVKYKAIVLCKAYRARVVYGDIRNAYIAVSYYIHKHDTLHTGLIHYTPDYISFVDRERPTNAETLFNICYADITKEHFYNAVILNQPPLIQPGILLC